MQVYYAICDTASDDIVIPLNSVISRANYKPISLLGKFPSRSRPTVNERGCYDLKLQYVDSEYGH